MTAVTAGVIESEIGAKNTCDFQRYYSESSAYSTIADAIKRRMEVPTSVRPRLLSFESPRHLKIAFLSESICRVCYRMKACVRHTIMTFTTQS